jgi:hypothetical protein
VALRRIVGVCAVLCAVVAACVPPDQPPAGVSPLETTLEAVSGTTQRVEVSVPGVHTVMSSVPTPAARDGVELSAAPSVLDRASVALQADVGVEANPGDVAFTVAVTGCRVVPSETGCGVGDTQKATIDVTVRASAPGAEPPDGFVAPGAFRWVETMPGVFTLPGELALFAADNVSAAEIGQLVVGLGGGLTGADAKYGNYQARFADVAAVRPQLEASDLLDGVEEVTAVADTTLAEPADWADDGADAKWTFEQAGAVEAWDRTTGSLDVQVGVYDSGFYPHHDDHRPVTSYRVVGNPFAGWSAGSHGTHVAGTACLRDGNGGLVGVARVCSLNVFDRTDGLLAWYEQLNEWRRWLDDYPEIRVVNMSNYWYGPGKMCDDAPAGHDNGFKDARRFFTEEYPDRLFVLAAGNCGHAGRRAEDILPQKAGKGLDNVIIVSGTKKATALNTPGSRNLAFYSAPDGDIAAPGGDPSGPVWSTTHRGCSLTMTPTTETAGCESIWEGMYGTSMAAPFITGTAALMLSLDPDLTPAQLKACIIESGASSPVSGGEPGLGEVWVPAALDCANAGDPGTDPGNASTLAAGDSHTCAVVAGGTIRCWGRNGHGQLGDGTTTDRSTPVTVQGLTGVTQLAAGGYHTCAVVAGGTIRCWGRNGNGQLGDGTTTDRSTPVTVQGLTGVTQLTTGLFHTCAVVAGGAVKCWGYNSSGQLGDGTTTDRWTPVTVQGLTGATQLATGDLHTCAVVAGGTIKCWGYNAYGHLGDGTTTDRWTPVTVQGLTDVAQLAAGGYHTCAVVAGGTFKCWGYNEYGQLGDGTTTDRSTVVTVQGLAGVTQFATGYWHTCAVVAGDAVKCWGDNRSGQLGDGTTDNRSTPVTVAGL